MSNDDTWNDIYPRVERAITFIAEHAPHQPSLAEVAHVMALSPTHAQRVFQRWAGLSPKRLAQTLTWITARQRLRDGASVLEATFDAQLSSPGRLHDLALTLDAMTPGEAKRQGEGLTLSAGIAESPLGLCVLATTERGICALRFVESAEDFDRVWDTIAKEWPRAALVRCDSTAADCAHTVFRTQPASAPELRLLVKATRFQIQVWRALLCIPEGHVVSYAHIARAIGKPRSARAVGQAVGANPIAHLIPCHRVLRASGALGGYRWGTARKRVMLIREAGRHT